MKPYDSNEALRPKYVGADLIRQTAREHAEINGVIYRLERELDRSLEGTGKRQGHWALPELARSCNVHLRRHFQFEEFTGLLATGLHDGDAEARRMIDKLTEEHREFERRIDRIAVELEMGFVPTSTVQRCFDGELRALITDIALHESVESELLQRYERRKG